MAKAKKNKTSAKAKTSSSSDVAKKDGAKREAAKKDDAPPIVKQVETAYELGNHSAVRTLAAAAASEHLEGKALARVDDALEKTRTEPLVWAIGVGAFALALIVAMATLGG